MRNLIFMHLESLNYMNYQINRGLFPNLKLWERKSLSFSNYYSTATSTLMVLGDLMYGGMTQYEICDSFDFIPDKYIFNASLLDQLRKEGYKTRVLLYPDGGELESADKRHIVGFNNKMILIQEYQDYMEEIEKAIEEIPFGLVLGNFISNVSLSHYIPYGRFESGLDRWRSGYEFMDSYVGEILKLLEMKNLIEYTTIIFYGDHGDDYFTHGYHKGLTHAIEPYANLIHTPFWIYDSRLSQGGFCDDLINTTDIKFIVENLLETPEEKICWNDLNISSRKYTVARNAYAAQPVREGTFNKGYSITDGKFLLLVSNYGMELYNIEMDMQCQNNLLKLFIYENNILYLNEELNSTLVYHYRSIMNMSAIRQVRQWFYYYRKKLYDEVLKLFCSAGCEQRLYELDFEQIHYD